MSTDQHGQHGQQYGQKASWNVVLLSYPCRVCGAPPGQPCITLTGRVKRTEVHTDRSYQASDRHWVAGDIPECAPSCVHCGDDPPPSMVCAQCGKRASNLADE